MRGRPHAGDEVRVAYPADAMMVADSPLRHTCRLTAQDEPGVIVRVHDSQTVIVRLAAGGHVTVHVRSIRETE
jgi:hypothetical protein